MTTTIPDTAATGFRLDAPADRFMRRLLGVREPHRGSDAAAHRAFRTSVLVSAVRCIITYVVVPVVVPLLSLSGWVAAPIGIALCVYAVVNGVVSLRRFWATEHRHRWLYAGFMAIVFVVLGFALVSDISRLGGIA